MTDYIKREDAIKILEGWKISGEMILATVPSDDVVEVVRCKDCKYYDNVLKDHCFLQAAGDDDYCSYGERKDEGL